MAHPEGGGWYEFVAYGKLGFLASEDLASYGIIFVMSRSTVLLVFAAANAVALVCVVQPWTDAWRDRGLVFFALEAVLTVVIGLPVFLHHFVRRGKSFRESLADSLDTVMDFLAGAV